MSDCKERKPGDARTCLFVERSRMKVRAATFGIIEMYHQFAFFMGYSFSRDCIGINSVDNAVDEMQSH